MNEIIFELKDVHYSYLGKFPAVCGVDMTIRQGEKIAVIGANGTGKSTLLHLLDGLIFPDKGELKAFGTPLTEDFINNSESSRNFRSKVGLVFQNADIQLFCPTVREDIAFGPLQLGVKDDEVQKTVAGNFTNFRYRASFRQSSASVKRRRKAQRWPLPLFLPLTLMCLFWMSRQPAWIL